MNIYNLCVESIKMQPKKILLLYKISTFQYYQKFPKECRPDYSEMDRFKETHHTHLETVAMIESLLSDHGLCYEKVARGGIEDYSEFDLIITVGGDGTFLEGARYSSGQPILGVNSDPNWSVGRLCLANPKTFDYFLKAFLSDGHVLRKVNRMKVSFKKSGIVKMFVNDILAAHTNPASMSRYVLDINGECEEQRGSGIWFSTAAGSTGAICSAGGAMIDLESSDYQYVPRELYKGWRRVPYRFQGGILSQTDQASLTSLMMEGVVFIDGSHQRIPFDASERLTISRAETPLFLVAMSAD